VDLLHITRVLPESAKARPNHDRQFEELKAFKLLAGLLGTSLVPLVFLDQSHVQIDLHLASVGQVSKASSHRMYFFLIAGIRMDVPFQEVASSDFKEVVVLNVDVFRLLALVLASHSHLEPAVLALDQFLEIVDEVLVGLDLVRDEPVLIEVHVQATPQVIVIEQLRVLIVLLEKLLIVGFLQHSTIFKSIKSLQFRARIIAHRPQSIRLNVVLYLLHVMLQVGPVLTTEDWFNLLHQADLLSM
jgi:hypothetical protein